MSTVDPYSTGSLHLHYRLIERVGSSVWKAEDTRNGKGVAMKILTKQLPKEPARRDALVREIRLGAAIYHTFLVPIQEIVVAGDALLMVMEWVDGQTLSKAIDGKPLDRHRFFRIAYQIASVLKLLHGKGYVHGNLGGDSILLTANDHVRVGGLNALNVMTKREGGSSTYQQKGTEFRSVAYMAPEQISGQPVDARTDIYSLGVVLYETATGRLPHQAQSASEMAHRIVSEAPANPKAVYPAVDNAALGIVGKCLFKESFSRYKDVKLLIDDINKVDPEAAKHANVLSSRVAAVAAPGAKPAAARKSLLLIGEIANYEELKARDGEAASRAAARMQQVLGEAVYLFDGKVVDPFGPLMIAELSSVENALEAARKGEFDFSPEQQEGPQPIQVRLLLHAGEVTGEEGKIAGDAVTKAISVLPELPPLKLFVSEEFAKVAKTAVRLRDAAARGGMKLYTIVPPEPPKPEPPPEESVSKDETAPPPPPPPKSKAVIFIPAGAALAGVLVVAVMLMLRKEAPAPPPAAPKPAAVAKAPNKVLVQPFAIDGTDATLLERANAIRLATIEILRSVPELQVIDAPADDSVTVTGTVRLGTAGPEFVAEPAAAPVQLADAAAGIDVLLRSISSKTNVTLRGTAGAEALNAFADAVAAKAANDPAKTEAALRTAVKADPNFLPAQLMAMTFFESRGLGPEALDAAKAVLALRPDHTDAARRVARASLSEGDVRGAFTAYGAILKKDGSDLEALNTIARYAIAVGDMQRFNAASTKLRAHPPATHAAHPPDHLAATGRIEAAINQYYDLEVNVPNNPALALKIGRIAVLRHTLPIADLELGKLQQSDPGFGYNVLKAYVAAAKRDRSEAMKSLEAAKAAARPGDDYWIAVAEVHAMLADADGAIAALEQSVAKREPGSARVLSNSLFEYLESDSRFQSVKGNVAAQQAEIRAALAQVAL